MAVCGSCDARDGERIRSRERSRTGVARVCGDVGSVAAWPSGREWNGSQPGQGASELGFPRPAPGEMQSEAARRAGDPSHQSEDPPPEGLGGYGPFAQTNPRRPAGEVMRHHLDRQPGAVGCETPRRRLRVLGGYGPFAQTKWAFRAVRWSGRGYAAITWTGSRARRRWLRGNAPTACGSARRRT